jgi:hypothetical protein
MRSDDSPLAAWDMDAAAGAAQALIERAAPRADHALEVAMVVCYARPFRQSKEWVAPLGEDEWCPDDENAARLHRGLLLHRDKTFAHTDRESGRDVVDVGTMLGDGTPFYAVSYPEGIRQELRSRIAGLCETQRGRFRGECRRLEAQLAEILNER